MKNAVRFTLAALALLVSAPASAQTLWQNVTVGMTPSQALAAQPAAHHPAKPSTLHNKASCELAIDDYKVGGLSFEVCFYFLNGKLIQVTLSADQNLSMGGYNAIVTLLRAKYGPELSSERNAIGYEATWLTKDGVNVMVLYIDRLTPLLNIVYQTRVAQDSSRL